MAASSTDLLKHVSRKWVGQIGSGGVANNTVDTIPLASSTNLPTDTGVVLTIDRVDSSGVATPSKEETIIGVVSGDNIVSATRGAEGTAQAHTAGAVVEVLLTAKGYNDIIDAFLVAFNQDGTIKSGTVLTVPQINDTSSNHQYVVSACELTADRTVQLPLLTGNDEFVFKDHTQTLTNKTATATSNNIAAKSLHSATTVVDVVSATAPTSGQVLTATSGTAATWQTPGAASAAGSIIASGLDTGPTSDADSTSSSFADQTGLTLTLALGASTGTVVAWLAQQVASTNVDTQVAVRIVIGASNGAENYAKPGAVSTAGEGISAYHLATGQTGNVVVKAQIARQAGSGTARAYGSHGHLMAIAIKE